MKGIGFRIPWTLVACLIVILLAVGATFLIFRQTGPPTESSELDPPPAEGSEDEQDIRSLIERLVTSVREGRGTDLLNLVHIERMLEAGAAVVPLPEFDREGKSYLTLAFGCTGERHRSVAVTHEVLLLLRDLGCDARLRHRDIDNAQPS